MYLIFFLLLFNRTSERHRKTTISHCQDIPTVFPRGKRTQFSFPSRESSIDLSMCLGVWKKRPRREVSCKPLLLSSLWHINICLQQRSTGPTIFLNMGQERGKYTENAINTYLKNSILPHSQIAQACSAELTGRIFCLQTGQSPVSYYTWYLPSSTNSLRNSDWERKVKGQRNKMAE